MREFLTWLYFKYLSWKYNLVDWKLSYKDMITDGGYTIIKDKHIVLSRYAVDRLDIYQLRDLIIHEVSHALSPGFPPHKKEWRETCKKLGGSGETRCSDFTLPQDYRWKAICKNCSTFIYYERRAALWCKTCGNYLEYKINKS